MRRRTIGVVDYDVGNLASVGRALHAVGYRCRISSDPHVLDATDLLLLPGVGAFHAAMAALHERELVGYLQERARGGKPTVGICLGMQLLADVSSEYRLTAGLGLIPGRVEQMSRWHIGWNSVEAVSRDALFRPVDGQSVYFNHSFVFQAPQEYQRCIARMEQESFTIAVRRDAVVGLQFHPEKSQAAGRQLLGSVVEGLCND